MLYEDNIIKLELNTLKITREYPFEKEKGIDILEIKEEIKWKCN